VRTTKGEESVVRSAEQAIEEWSAELKRLDAQREDLKHRIRRMRRIRDSGTDIQPKKRGRPKVDAGDMDFVEAVLREYPDGLRAKAISELAVARGFKSIAEAHIPRLKAAATLNALLDEQKAYRTAGNIWRLIKKLR
jgi:hypothetical protein